MRLQSSPSDGVLQGQGLDEALRSVEILETVLATVAATPLRARLRVAEAELAKLVSLDQEKYERWRLVVRVGNSEQKLEDLRVRFRDVVVRKDECILASYGLARRPEGAPPVPPHAYLPLPGPGPYPFVPFMRTAPLAPEEPPLDTMGPASLRVGFKRTRTAQ